jgi:DNA repair exonuclease SbcCD ATPase subunit
MQEIQVSGLIDYRKKFSIALATKNIWEERKQSLDKKIINLERLLIASEELHAFFQKVALETQQQIRIKLENVVNMALDSIFPNRYRFELKFEMKYGQTEASPILYDGKNELNPSKENGGGIIDILCFSLRVALLLISKNSKVLILDEPFHFMDADIKPLGYEVMQNLSHTLGIQIILVTHQEEAIERSDKVFKVAQIKGISILREL